MKTLPIPDRDRLLIAYACCEWAGALTHLHALTEVGCRVPDDVVVQIGDELTSFTTMWSTVHDQAWSVVESANHAAVWLSEHTDELDALLKEEAHDRQAQ